MRQFASALALLAVAAVSAPLGAQPGMPRQDVGPGEGPQRPFYAEDWEYWWYLNQEPLLERARVRLRQRGIVDQRALAPPGTEDRERIAAALREAARDEDARVREASLVALARMGDRRGLPVMLDLLGDGVLGVRRTALLSLGLLGDPAAAPRLLEVVLDPRSSGDEVVAAAVGLAFLDAAALPAEPPEVPAAAGAAPAAPPFRVVAEGLAQPRDVCFTPDGARLLVALGDGALVELPLDEEDGAARRLEVGSAPLVAVSISGSGDFAAVAAATGGATFVSLRLGRVVRAIRGSDESVAALRFDRARGERVFVAQGAVLRSVALAGGAAPRSIRAPAEITAFAELDGGDKLALGGADGVLRLVFASNGAPWKELPSGDAPVVAVAASPDGRFVAAGDARGAVTIWRLDVFLPQGTLRLDGPISALDFTADGRLLAVVTPDGRLRWFDAAGGDEVASIASHATEAELQDARVALALAPDGTRAATCGPDGRVVLHGVPGVEAAPAATPAVPPLDGEAPLAALLERETFFGLSQPTARAVALAAHAAREPRLVPSILALLERKASAVDPVARGHLIGALAANGGFAVAEPLARFLTDEHVHARRAAALGLTLFLDGPSDAALSTRAAKALRDDGDALARGFLSLGLGALGGSVALEPLAEALADRKGGVVRGGFVVAPKISLDASAKTPFAALGLGLTGDPRVRPLMMRALGDESVHSIRAGLAIAIGLLSDPRAAAPIRKELRGERDPILRGHLALAAGMCGDLEATDALLEILADEVDVELVPNAARAVDLLGRRDGLEALLVRLERERKPDARRVVVYCLGVVGDRAAIEPLLGVLGGATEDAAVRAAAATALGHVCDRVRPRRLSRLTFAFDVASEPHLLHWLLTIP